MGNGVVVGGAVGFGVGTGTGETTREDEDVETWKSSCDLKPFTLNTRSKPRPPGALTCCRGDADLGPLGAVLQLGPQAQLVLRVGPQAVEAVPVGPPTQPGLLLVTICTQRPPTLGPTWSHVSPSALNGRGVTVGAAGGGA